jgi:hypothetical protein
MPRELHIWQQDVINLLHERASAGPEGLNPLRLCCLMLFTPGNHDLLKPPGALLYDAGNYLEDGKKGRVLYFYELHRERNQRETFLLCKTLTTVAIFQVLCFLVALFMKIKF